MSIFPAPITVISLVITSYFHSRTSPSSRAPVFHPVLHAPPLFSFFIYLFFLGRPLSVCLQVPSGCELPFKVLCHIGACGLLFVFLLRVKLINPLILTASPYCIILSLIESCFFWHPLHKSSLIVSIVSHGYEHLVQALASPQSLYRI